jgi:hypothetical protein
MTEFDFLKAYIGGIPEPERVHRAHGHIVYGYILQEGKKSAEIVRLEQDAGVVIPDELRQFYQFSYGDPLGEYEVLTIPKIADLIPQMRSTYEEDWRDSILPFAYLRGVGDVVAFDMGQRNDEGVHLILDGFHEYGPSEWDGVCFGLRTWLLRMVESHFHPFWFVNSEEPAA